MKKCIWNNLSLMAVVLMAVLVFFACRDNDNVEETTSFTIHTIGDSTMAHKAESARPETGWGEFIQCHIVDTSLVHHVNYAVNGRSTKNFIAEGRWDKVKSNIKKGDYVFIQFGHNDQKASDSLRYVNASTSYRDNLRRFVNETRGLGGTPILLTPIVRRNFNEYGVLIDAHGIYPEVMRQVASEMNVTLVDAQLVTEKLVLAYGPEGSKKLYNHVESGHVNYPDGKIDNTHLNGYGAQKVAEVIVESIRESDSRLAVALK